MHTLHTISLQELLHLQLRKDDSDLQPFSWPLSSCKELKVYRDTQAVRWVRKKSTTDITADFPESRRHSDTKATGASLPSKRHPWPQSRCPASAVLVSHPGGTARGRGGATPRVTWPPLLVRHTSFAGHQKSQGAEQARLQLGRDSLESQALGMDSENPEGKSTVDEQRCLARCASPEAGPVLWRGAVFGHKGNLYLSVPSSLCAQPRTWNPLLPSSGLLTTCRCTCVLTDTCVSCWVTAQMAACPPSFQSWCGCSARSQNPPPVLCKRDPTSFPPSTTLRPPGSSGFPVP